ncbi:LysM peptidoglycan-binding domain-containing protein [Fulvivirgaceae bacterium BMA12]|uniref:LysM peptidoglycan-binding domain-containing protein n=1 Tax=Agaribacillus aureus TaxID=3051825 RepID=A0ABT8LC66_9BACT|nr:LysM peptidoglycan-binding domain-containing protein [Fulvivirgaceae bacterium BMA12]
MKLLNWTLLLLFISLSTRISAQKVPTYMDFADIKLKITEAAKREIQKDVDMLTRSPKYFGIKVDRANLYFPIIERIFREQGLPDDFKYLVLQESALIPDAVSSSNAIGFWQFKKAAAKEVGLRVDGVVDERMNIVSASRGAAKYLKKYNTLFFNNWLYTLQSYNVGPGGALRSLDKKKYGAKRMIIDKKTHWYVKKYLSHKVAFESAVNHRNASRKLAELTNNSVSNLRDINRKYGVDVDVLKNYNKWLKGRKIPDDKTYTVVIPVDNSANKQLLALVNSKKPKAAAKPKKFEKKEPEITVKTVAYNAGSGFPEIEKKVIKKSGLSYTKINGLPGMVANEQASISSLAERGGISTKKFRAYNDLSSFDRIIPGQVYYFKRKKTKARIHYYGAKRNESLWSISQKFGIRLDKLLLKNRMLTENDLTPGRVLWLRFIRPEEEPIEFIELPDQKPDKIIIAKNTTHEKELTPPKKEEQQKEDEKNLATEESAGTIDKPENTDNNATALDSEDIWEDPEENEKWLNEDINSNENGQISSQEEPQLNIIDRKNPSPPDEFTVDENPRFINTATPSATIVNGKKIHVIKQGETLFSIARTYNITVDDLKNWNNLEDMGNIKFDQQLIVGLVENVNDHVQISPSQPKSQSILLHEVEEGDTIFSISRSYNMPIQKIMELNQKTDYNIAIGEKLKVVKTK